MAKPWAVGDRVAWPHREGAGNGRHTVQSAGTVTAVDEPGLPPGVRVTFDEPVRGATSCYATHDEVEPLPPFVGRPHPTTTLTRRNAPPVKRERLTIVPLTFRQASAFVAQYHRHNKPPRGCKFCIGVADEAGTLRGVLMAGRPIARGYDDGLTIEVNRTATDGFPNANSALYGAAWRIAAAMGYRRLITYTQLDESGASMRALGALRVRDLPARKGWAECSVALKAIRDPIGNGGVDRTLWRLGEPLPNEQAGGEAS